MAASFHAVDTTMIAPTLANIVGIKAPNDLDGTCFDFEYPDAPRCRALEVPRKTESTRIYEGQVLTLNATGGSLCRSRGGSISVDPGRVLLTDELVAIGSS
jgi:hypothetical protein